LLIAVETAVISWSRWLTAVSTQEVERVQPGTWEGRVASVHQGLVVGADGARQSVLAKEPVEDRPHAGALGEPAAAKLRK
jgi:hypothetical protein